MKLKQNLIKFNKLVRVVLFFECVIFDHKSFFSLTRDEIFLSQTCI